MRIGSRQYNIGDRTYIVGILNVTPDSFSDGGNFDTIPAAIAQAKKLEQQGADIIEVGGESTRPGYHQVDEDTEINRVIPIIRELKKHLTVPIAVDTSKSKVAEIAIKNGVNLINDVWGAKKDKNLAKVCAEYDVPVCVMHNRDNMNYKNFLVDVVSDLKDSISILLSAGVKPNNIIIDPGIGFVKTPEQNIEVLRNLSIFTSLPYPVMLGTSKKSFMGATVGFELDDRIESTIATTVLGIQHHCAFIRVHNVAENKKAAIMADNIIRHRHK